MHVLENFYVYAKDVPQTFETSRAKLFFANSVMISPPLYIVPGLYAVPVEIQNQSHSQNS